MGEIEHRRLTLQWNDWPDAHYSVNGNLESGQDLEVVAAEDFDRLAQQHTAAVEALRRIKADEGKVCDQFEVCNHRACNSSYTAWAIADEYLRGQS
jgi:hypothetical protein